jgi:hypothetical protein
MRSELNQMNRREIKGPVVSVCHSTPFRYSNNNIGTYEIIENNILTNNRE